MGNLKVHACSFKYRQYSNALTLTVNLYVGGALGEEDLPLDLEVWLDGCGLETKQKVRTVTVCVNCTT